jgi:hypothetical protein
MKLEVRERHSNESSVFLSQGWCKLGENESVSLHRSFSVNVQKYGPPSTILSGKKISRLFVLDANLVVLTLYKCAE